MKIDYTICVSTYDTQVLLSNDLVMCKYQCNVVATRTQSNTINTHGYSLQTHRSQTYKKTSHPILFGTFELTVWLCYCICGHYPLETS